MPDSTGNNDAFETPPSSPVIADEYANGDLYKEKVPDELDVVETRCGYWQCRPDALQKCNNPKALLMFLCCFSMAQGTILPAKSDSDFIFVYKVIGLIIDRSLVY